MIVVVRQVCKHSHSHSMRRTITMMNQKSLNKQPQKMTNPFVIVIGIEDYSDARNKYNKKQYQDLNGVSIDV